ncbi:MAG TPA: lamin tail domain-containing protein [Thermoanaerobaculia bacterium]
MSISITAIGRSQPTELFFSEYIEGSSNNKALEIFNGTGTAVDLAASVYNVQMHFNGNPVAGLTINLSGTVANGDVFVLAHSSADPAILALADQTNGAGWFNGDDAVVLRKDTAVIDVIGQIGFDPGTEWGTGLTSTADNTLRRKCAITMGDTNGSDAFDPSIEWDGFANNTFSGLGSHCGLIGVGSANPASVAPGASTFLTVAVTPVENPISTGITVTGDLTMIGGSATQPFFDDGTNGDVTPGDNVFSYQATVAVGTTPGNKTLPISIADAQLRSATTTINLTVEPPLVEIHDIQGSGTASPYAGQLISTTGIVTGRRFNNGFFLQEPDASVDGDPNTSEGIFVFTSSAPPAAAEVGNLVRVTGTVQEFIPSPDPFSPPLTEIAGSPIVTLLSTNNLLPAPVTLTAADTSPAGSPEQLERFEGMRVHVSSLTVVGPTLGSINEANATANSNGVFYGVITGLPRPLREPGINVLDPLPAGSPCCVPRFDENPERIRVDSDGLAGAVRVEATTHATVANLIGPLDYAFRTYTILPDPGTLTQASVIGNVVATPVSAPGADEFTVASFNLERFFDTADDPAISEPVLTETAFNGRLNKASLAIRNVLGSPDVLGVVEVENLTALQAIADKINNDTVGDGGANPAYTAYLVEGNDVGGIDVGFLVKESRVDVSDLTQEGKNTTYINPNNGQPELLNDRPPLVLRADIKPSGGGSFGVTVIVNHLRSLSDVDDAVEGNRVRTKRRAQAEFLANLVQVRQGTDSDERIVLVGDFNAFQFNDGYVDSIGTIKGTPADPDEVVLASSDLVNPDFTNLIDSLPPSERYSFVFDGNAQVLDHILAGSNLLGHVRGIEYGRVGSDFPESFRNDATRPERISDHDGIVVSLTFDIDGDGVPDDSDACDASSSSATVVIDGCDSGAENDLFSDGCKITDRIDDCAASAVTHDDFTACVTQLTNDLKRDGFITNKEKAGIQKCAGRARIP